jgi:ABC-type multidrug transport system fused ATPase/permease subunit
VLLLLPVAGFMIGRIGKSLKRKSQKEQSQLGYLMSLFEESLSGVRIIKAFNAERYQKGKFLRENKHLEHLSTSAHRRWNVASPLIEFLSVTVVAADSRVVSRLHFSVCQYAWPCAKCGQLLFLYPARYRFFRSH